MPPPSKNLKVACLQLTCGGDFAKNFATITKMAHQAASAGTDIIFTPENSDLMAVSPAKRLEFATHWEQTESEFAQLAKSLNKWLAVGSIAAKTPSGAFNRSILFDGKGRVHSRYDKIHLFDFTSPTESHRESATFQNGTKAVIANTPLAKLGLTICYDLRFGYLYRFLAQNGCGIVAVPAAFTRQTGKVHWLTLLKARAIECGMFVVAAAQCGVHSATRKTWGHSVVISPWGEVLAQAGDTPEVLTATLDLSKVAEARQRLPAWNQERNFTALIK